MTRTQVFLITTTLAGAYGLGEMELGEAKAAIPTTKDHQITGCLGGPATTAFLGYVDQRLCPTVDADLGLSGEDACSAADDARKICFFIEPGATCQVRYGAGFDIQGQFTPGNPSE